MTDGFQRLAWRNRFVKKLSQEIQGADCFSPFAFLNPDSNLILLDLTEAQFTRMFSALLTGADISYPDESHQIQVDFLKGLHCPPSFDEAECIEYPTYANFITYEPANPYIDPNFVPDGYLEPPFLVNGENGNDLPNFEHYDVIVPFGAITLDFNWFEDIAGALPTIKVMVNGAGTVQLRLLAIPQGGMAVVTLDNPPNILDIISGIVTGAENIVDLNQDLISLPPETAQEIIFPVTVEGTGLHTIYVVFLPIIDDALIPIRFGGGLRGVNLCDFVEAEDMGITAIRFNGCDLEFQNNGVWAIVPGWENWLDCVPSGVGGGVSTLKTTIYSFELPANQDTTSTVNFVEAPGTVQAHQFTRSKALIFAEFQLLNTNAGSNAFAFVAVNDAPPSQNGVERIGGNAGETLYVTGGFESLDTANPSSLSIYFRANANTARIGTGSRLIYTILEYEDASELFVEDVRIFDGELQKRIGGAWIPVTDSFEAIISNLQGQINSLNGLVTVAQSTANAAQTTANGAVTMNNNQNVRLAAIETWQDNADIRFSAIDAINTNQQTRIEQLEDKVAVLSFGNVWAWFHDFELNQFTYAVTGSGTYLAGVGFLSVSGDLRIDYTAETIKENQISHIQATIIYDNVVGTPSVRFSTNGTDYGVIAYRGEGVQSKGWLRVPNMSVQQFLSIRFEGVNCDFILKEFRYLGRGDDVPFD